MQAVLRGLELATAAAQKEELSEEWRVRLLTAAIGLTTALQKPEETLMREAFWVCVADCVYRSLVDRTLDGQIYGYACAAGS